jgi:hypothetical protein
VLRERKLILLPSKGSEILINGFTIERISLRIGTEDNFNFGKPAADAKETVRQRVKELEALNYYVLDIIRLNVMVDVVKSLPEKNEKNGLDILNILTKIEKIKISSSKQKNFGHNKLEMLE